MNKRGVSAVVGSVLLIVITVISVALIISFILPFIKDKLGESEECLNALDSIEFAPSKFNCYKTTTTADETGFSVKVKNDKIKGFRIALIDDINGSSKVYDISDGITNPELRMVGGAPGTYNGALIFPNAGGQRSYVANGIYSEAEIAPILENNRVCDVADKVVFKACHTNVIL